MSNLEFPFLPDSKRRYPENPSATVKRLPELVRSGDSSYVGADDEPQHGIAVYKGYGAISFENDLVLYVVVEPAPKGRDWRKESKHMASYTFRLEQAEIVGDERFYAPAEVKVDARLVSRPRSRRGSLHSLKRCVAHR